ncbi:hypothetical protein Tco_1475111, partial [Tanacetum coccineum]
AAKFVRDFKSLGKEADESLSMHKSLEYEIELPLRAVVSQDIMSIVQSNSFIDKVSEQKEKTKGTSSNTKFTNQSTMGKPSLHPLRNNFIVRKPNAFQRNDQNLQKLGFLRRINPFKTSREDKFVPINKARVSVRTKPIIISQPHVITKKDVNSDSNGLSSTGVDNTA